MLASQRASSGGEPPLFRSDRREVLRAHPLLDPLLPSRQPAVARYWVRVYRRLVHDSAGHSELLRPDGESGIYLDEADRYVDELLRKAPPRRLDHLRLLPRIRSMQDAVELFRLVFEGPDARIRYEAQRKLYLAKLIHDVDLCRSVRDGPRHRAYIEKLFDRQLWSGIGNVGETEVICRPASDRCWRFRLHRLAAHDGEPEIRVYYSQTRFKREASEIVAERTSDGTFRVVEAFRWPVLGRRSGSIVSKMLRQGIGDPNMVQDLLGAMFIVGDRRQVYALEQRLARALGGPFRFRDRVDTIAREEDRARLGARSSKGYQVLKQIVDVLVEDGADMPPYFVPVELQIHPLESYLRTLQDAQLVSHAAYKRRQLVNDLLPLLFPAEIYGMARADELP
jgi:hypothetical protein